MGRRGTWCNEPVSLVADGIARRRERATTRVASAALAAAILVGSTSCSRGPSLEEMAGLVDARADEAGAALPRDVTSARSSTVAECSAGIISGTGSQPMVLLTVDGVDEDGARDVFDQVTASLGGGELLRDDLWTRSYDDDTFVRVALRPVEPHLRIDVTSPCIR